MGKSARAAHLWVVHFLLCKPGVDDVVDAVDGEAGLRDVGRDDDLARARRRGVENARLHLGGEARVDGQDDELRDGGAQALHALEEHLARGVDLVLACGSSR